MKAFRVALMLAFGIADQSLASRLEIPFAGGKKTGIFAITGDAPADSNSVDTVRIGGSILLTNYISNENAQFCFPGTGNEFGLFASDSGGAMGSVDSTDTIWNAHAVFPAILNPLDSIPSPGLTSAKNLGSNPHGLRVGLITRDGECAANGFQTYAGYNRVIYFSYRDSLGTHYGRWQISGYNLHQPRTFPSDGALDAVQIGYSLSDDSTDLGDSPLSTFPRTVSTPSAMPRLFRVDGGMVLFSVPSAGGGSNRFFDPNGERCGPLPMPGGLGE